MSNYLEQLINEPTHIRDDGSQSCIALICTNQPYMFIGTEVLSSLDSHSKHNIIHGTLNINIPRLTPYKRKLWEYKSARADLIRGDLLAVNWQGLLFNLNVSEKTLLFAGVFMDIMNKHISNKGVTFNNKDAPWLTTAVKTAIKRNSRAYRK